MDGLDGRRDSSDGLTVDAAGPSTPSPKLLFLVTEDWYFLSHRLPIARAARERGYRVLVATRTGAHAQRIRAEGFELIPLRLRRRRSSPWNEIASLAELVTLYRRERPDIVHHVAMKPVLYGSIAARLAGVPHVVNALAGLGYVFTSSGTRARLLRPVVRFALARVLGKDGGCVIVQNPDDARALRAIGVAGERIAVIAGSGVDTRRFSPAPEPAGRVVVCMISRMLWDKGVGELVEAARLLARDGPAVDVWLVGDPDPGNPASIAESTLRDWTRSGVVQWLGQRDDVPELWQRAHIAVLPSYREGLPKSLVEAAASARPLVACDVPGCREIVVHDETGLLVPAREAGALAEAIRRLAADADLRRRLGEAARRRVVERFSEEQVIADTMTVYANLLDDDRRAVST